MSEDIQVPTYQLKVILRHSKPSIWRRFLVPASMNLEELHHTLQIVMGWEDEHLHEFLHKKQRYGIPDEGYDDGSIDEFGVTLGGLLKKEGDSLTYLYDFGDGWEHELLLEKIRPWREGAELPLCTAGARACPPEDVGGIHGYERLLKILRKPSHEEYEDMLDWIGEDFDARRFDKEEVNEALRHFLTMEEGGIFAGFEEEELAAIMAKPLSEKDSALIDRYFPNQGVVGNQSLTRHGLQGFVSATICAPLPVFPGEWIEALLDTYEIEVPEEGEMQELLVALLKFSNQLAVAFIEGEPLLPEPYDIDTTPQGTSEMELWCDGFLHGFHFNEDDWFDLDDDDAIEELESCAAIIAALAMRELDNKNLSASEFREKMTMVQAALPMAIGSLYGMARSDLYAYFVEDFHEEMDIDLPAVSTKIGRNELCPCGSGRKYMNCCIDKPLTLH